MKFFSTIYSIDTVQFAQTISQHFLFVFSFFFFSQQMEHNTNKLKIKILRQILFVVFIFVNLMNKRILLVFFFGLRVCVKRWIVNAKQSKRSIFHLISIACVKRNEHKRQRSHSLIHTMIPIGMCTAHRLIDS